MADGPPGSNFRRLREYERVLDVHAKVPDGVFNLGARARLGDLEHRYHLETRALIDADGMPRPKVAQHVGIRMPMRISRIGRYDAHGRLDDRRKSGMPTEPSTMVHDLEQTGAIHARLREGVPERVQPRRSFEIAVAGRELR